MSTAEGAINQQRDLHTRIGRAMENLKKLGKEKMTRSVLITRIQALDNNWDKFRNNHHLLVANQTKELKAHVYFVDDFYSECEEAYLDVKAGMLAIRDSLTEPNEGAQNQLPPATPTCRGGTARSFPKISLPRFSGKYNAWPPFRDLFRSMIIKNQELQPVEKLHYLKGHVAGDAARLIANLAITDVNFSHAWDALLARYENKRMLITAYLDQLFALKPLMRKSAEGLKDLLASVKEALGGLSSQEAPIHEWDLFLVYFLTRRLDSESLEAWELKLGRATEPASFQELEDFLEGRIRALEMIDPHAHGKTVRSAKSSSTAKPARAHAAVATSTACALCSAPHYISACPEFSAKSPHDRRDFAVAKKLCFNCLGAHRITECRSSKRCRLCSGHHHTLIHRASSSTPATTQLKPDASAETTGASRAAPSPSQPANALHTALPDDITACPRTLLATARVTVLTSHNHSLEARVLLDQGSELSFIRESLAQLLQVPRRQARIPIIGIGSQRVGATREAISLRLRSRCESDYELQVLAFVLPQLTTCTPMSYFSQSAWKHLDGLPLADPDFAKPGRIDIILGADVYGQLLRSSLRHGAPHEPVAQLTALGWIVSGPIHKNSQAPPARAHAHLAADSPDCELHDLLSRFWEQESIPASKKLARTREEEQCEEHFAATHTRTSTGRYMVRLPFRSNAPILGDSYTAAARMLAKTQQRFRADPAFAQLYADFLQEYQALGHMSPVSVAPSHAGRVFFLPHHGVLRHSSSTSKLRVVFNGSLRTTTGVTLNDCLHIGPKLQQDLSDILLRWRMHAYVFLADVEKMYRQIIVHPHDRDFQRILWTTAGHPSEYQLTTLTYGLACAPYLALRVLKQLADDEEATYPEAASVVREDMYVDDVLSGADTLPLAQSKASQTRDLLMAGGFSLHKWMTNETAVLSLITPKDSSDPVTHEFRGDLFARALGISWNPASDAFVFQLRPPDAPTLWTKRTVLSRVASLFDPLGWLTPITVSAKIFVQTLWKLQTPWDEPLPSTLANQWRQFENDLRTVSSISVPRWLGTTSSNLAMEIHGFSDASQDALGAALYLRVLVDLNDIRVALLVGKSKVAPIKRVTIPRLELSAAVILARLLDRVRCVLNLHDVPAHLWVDSSVVLSWVKEQPSRWKEFVANRVELIQELTPGVRWHHIAGHENPADCASRGIRPQDLAAHRSWWHGPSWLSHPSTSWPSELPRLARSINLKERAERTVLTSSPASPDIWDLVMRYSSLPRLLRITVWIARAVSLFKCKATASSSSSPSTMELVAAERFWVKATQTAYFSVEFKILARGLELPRSNKLIRFAPFVDCDGVLRVGGRLRNAQLDPDAKHPILLPHNAALSHLILDDVHRRILHGGVQSMLAAIRQKFWILGGRSPVSAFVRQCVRCCRYRAAAATELMGELPPTRVTPSRPFLHAGVDYAGPFSLRTFRGRTGRTYKGFLVLFVCFSTSAVHLELATDYSTQGFLAAYKRFTGRRGICATLTSDCGTNLVGADAELRRLFNSASTEFSQIPRALALDGTEWRFNPPSAPHFGGKWEAAVKSVKFHLRRLLKDTSLTYEEFNTVLIQVEAVLNSRSLSPISDDPSDVEALTPAHFLIGERLTLLPEPTLEDVPMNRLTRWQLLRHLLARFWTRWSSEYLQRLQDIAKWHHPSRQITIGSLVLLRDERYPPSKWPLARVIETHAGTDGLVRVATVRTSTSVFKRPIVKLCPLPIPVHESATSAADETPLS